MDAAINHFIEAGNSDKAIQAAIGAQQWKKAQLILDQSDSPSNAQYYRQIANHYNQTKQFEAAAKMMIKVNHSLGRKWTIQSRSDVDRSIVGSKRVRLGPTSGLKWTVQSFGSSRK